MPSSYTPSLRLELQAAGENLNTWGAPRLNNALGRVEAAIAGWTVVPLTGDHALTSANASDDEARSAMLKFTGVLAAACTVTAPSVSKSYLAWNATDKAVTLTTGAGATVILDAGDKVCVACDGTNFHELGYAGLGLKAFVAASVLAVTGSLPAVTGNAGKYLYCDGAVWSPRTPVTTDLADLSTHIAARTALAVAMAISL